MYIFVKGRAYRNIICFLQAEQFKIFDCYWDEVSLWFSGVHIYSCLSAYAKTVYTYLQFVCLPVQRLRAASCAEGRGGGSRDSRRGGEAGRHWSGHVTPGEEEGGGATPVGSRDSRRGGGRRGHAGRVTYSSVAMETSTVQRRQRTLVVYCLNSHYNTSFEFKRDWTALNYTLHCIFYTVSKTYTFFLNPKAVHVSFSVHDSNTSVNYSCFIVTSYTLCSHSMCIYLYNNNGCHVISEYVMY